MFTTQSTIYRLGSGMAPTAGPTQALLLSVGPLIRPGTWYQVLYLVHQALRYEVGPMIDHGTSTSYRYLVQAGKGNT